jgi:hypothetical protein
MKNNLQFFCTAGKDLIKEKVNGVEKVKNHNFIILLINLQNG